MLHRNVMTPQDRAALLLKGEALTGGKNQTFVLYSSEIRYIIGTFITPSQPSPREGRVRDSAGGVTSALRKRLKINVVYQVNKERVYHTSVKFFSPPAPPLNLHPAILIWLSTSIATSRR